MFNQKINASKIALFLVAALLLAVPVHAQTLKVSSTQVNLGEVIGCNDNQVINLTSSSTAIALHASIVYTSGDPRGNWLYVRDQSSGNSTTGASLSTSVPTGSTGLNLQLGLNLADSGQTNDSATVVLTTSSQTISVTVTYSPNLNCGGVTANNGLVGVSPGGLTFNVSQGNSLTQYIVVTNVTTAPETIFFSVPINSGFSVGIGSTTLAPGQKIAVPITAKSGNLAPGSYSGTITVLILGQGAGTPFNVTMNVSGNGVTGGTATAVVATPSVLNFSYVPGDVGFGAQTLQILNANPGPPTPVAVTVTTYNGGANWLTTDFVPGSAAPLAIHVSVNSLGLAPGTNYQGALVITPLGGPAIIVNISFVVTPPPVISATPASLKFNFTPGGATPAAQTIQVNGAGGVGPFTAAAVGGPWLHVFPNNGSTLNIGPAPVTVTVDPTGLLAGTTYNGTVTITGSGPSTGVSNVAVSFTIAGPGISKTSNAASYFGGPVAPGEIISLFGTTDNPIGPDTPVALTGDMIVNNRLPTTMGGTQVIFLPSGIAAPLIYASATQVNCQVPYEVAGQNNIQVQVQYGGITSRPFGLNTVATQPGLFTATSTGTGQALSAQYDAHGLFLGSNSPSNPVTRGNILTLYVTGEGKTTQPVTGSITSAQASAPYTPQPMAYPSVLIDGQPATIVFYGEAPGLMSGMMQVNVIVPPNVRVGPDVLVSITVGANYSQAGVTIATQ